MLLHGAVQTRTIWQDQFEALAGTRRLVAVDLRGHGETMLGSRRMSVEQMAADALAILDALQIRQAAICGVSLGGMVALELAERTPDRIASLILANTPTSLTSTRWLRSLVDRVDPQDLLPFAFRLFGRKRAARLGLALASRLVGPHWVGTTARRHFIDGFARMSPKAIVATYRAIVEARPVDAASIRCPILLIEGNADATSVNAQMDELGAQTPHARIETMPAGHVASLDDPAAFNRLLLRFLDRHDPPCVRTAAAIWSSPADPGRP
ncbi:alpha/beta fold hydrolase [Jiella sp. 40Bstr34]|uniref:Alpha/beta fold hydrolase n=2 Tax=Jiella pacifica TaxID=2696469 RepID=A0A6N9T2W4_9HYPH|nr:alpha/beta fold hydrolase [Jiella pacifica]